MTPDQYRREGAEAMREAAADAAYQWWDYDAQELREHVRAIDVDEVLAGLPTAPDPAAQLVEAARRHLAWIDYDFPSGVREQELAARNALRAALSAMEASHD